MNETVFVSAPRPAPGRPKADAGPLGGRATRSDDRGLT